MRMQPGRDGHSSGDPEVRPDRAGAPDGAPEGLRGVPVLEKRRRVLNICRMRSMASMKDESGGRIDEGAVVGGGCERAGGGEKEEAGTGEKGTWEMADGGSGKSGLFQADPRAANESSSPPSSIPFPPFAIHGAPFLIDQAHPHLVTHTAV